MLVSVLGYFFYIVAAFSIVMALLISSFSRATLVTVSRYPRPVIEPSVAVANTEPRHVAVASKVSEPSAQFADDSRANFAARPDTGNLARERHALETPADQRDGYEGRDYAAGPGYARNFGYSAGLETQR